MKPLILIALLFAGCQSAAHEPMADTLPAITNPKAMDLGNFSVSLAVKDLGVSQTFYENLGFAQIAGSAEQNYVILQNATSTIGLFQGMFEQNILTFNPGWNRSSETLDSYTDVRDLQRTLKERGVPFVTEADESTKGPGSFVVVDPDGNPILIDQHVD